MERHALRQCTVGTRFLVEYSLYFPLSNSMLRVSTLAFQAKLSSYDMSSSKIEVVPNVVAILFRLKINETKKKVRKMVTL